MATGALPIPAAAQVVEQVAARAEAAVAQAGVEAMVEAALRATEMLAVCVPPHPSRAVGATLSSWTWTGMA